MDDEKRKAVLMYSNYAINKNAHLKNTMCELQFMDKSPFEGITSHIPLSEKISISVDKPD